MGRFDEIAKAADRVLRFPYVFGSTRRAEDTLRNFRRIVDSIPAPVAVMTPEGEVETVNRPTLEYFGKTLEDLKGWSTADAVHPDDLPGVVAVWKKAIETGQTYEVESRHRRADGAYRWFHVRGFPLRDADGRIVRWCVLQTDIEARKQAEVRKAAILNSALDCIVTIDHEGRNHRVQSGRGANIWSSSGRGHRQASG